MKKFGKFNIVRNDLLILFGLSFISYGVYHCKDLFKDPTRCDSERALIQVKELLNQEIQNEIQGKCLKWYRTLEKKDFEKIADLVEKEFIEKDGSIVIQEFNSLTPDEKASCTGIAYYANGTTKHFDYTIEYDKKNDNLFTSVTRPNVSCDKVFEIGREWIQHNLKR